MQPDPRMQDFHAHLDRLAQESGLDLDDDDRRAIFEQSAASGFTPDSTVRAFDEYLGSDDEPDDDDWYDDDAVDEPEPEPEPVSRRDFEADWDHDVTGLERELGRKLSRSELQGIARGSIDQVQRHDNFHVRDALEDFHRDRGTDPDQSTWKRADWDFHMVERARELAGDDDQPDPDREYDLSNRDDWVDYAVQRMQGAEFEDG